MTFRIRSRSRLRLPSSNRSALICEPVQPSHDKVLRWDRSRRKDPNRAYLHVSRNCSENHTIQFCLMAWRVGSDSFEKVRLLRVALGKQVSSRTSAAD
jgi:hypothetical protein